MMPAALWLAAAVAALIGLHRLALFAEQRGWIYYLNRKASPGTAGRAFMEVQSLLEPGIRQVIESERSEKQEADDSAGPFPPDERACRGMPRAASPDR